MEIVDYIFGVVFLSMITTGTFFVLKMLYNNIVQTIIFKSGRNSFGGRNPFERICKKCSAHQNVYTYSWSGRSLWAEVYPIGNDKNCICHKYAKG